MVTFKHFAKAVYSRAKLSKMVHFVDEIEIDRSETRQKSFLSWPKSFWIDCMEETA